MDNSVPTAGSISIEAIDLLTSPEAGKETIDIRNYVGDVVIKESIFTNYFKYSQYIIKFWIDLVMVTCKIYYSRPALKVFSSHHMFSLSLSLIHI